MAKTLLDLDEDLLQEASTALGTTTKKETVTRALRAAIDESRTRRRQSLSDLHQLTDEGGFNFDLYDELDR